MRTDNLYEVPTSLPVPEDDGACDHLPGMQVPSMGLLATSGDALIDLSAVPSKWTVVYCYPRTGRPDQEPLGGTAAWNAIPGARGCTPQSCSYRDHFTELKELGATVFGLSTQDTDYQREVVERLHLPFPLLSEASLQLTRALRLPTFVVAGMEFTKRLTMILRAGRIERVFYPVFPSNSDAELVIDWLRSANAAS